ncbi:SGNH/GDSL hydrolase family protein [Rhodoflexus caldus]|uniref:SGNH/GDSL hydrolase family protein n=1 Tax=Rhodoflexus caldus TaxID=2891236 RepID=UPI00202A68CC|nr:SGNH/GDSL hydrolase family protein [Rhodoflexus caldus]
MLLPSPSVLNWRSMALLGKVAAHFPKLMRQGNAIRANTVRLPLPQDKPQGSFGNGKHPFKLLAFGESTVAGMGIASYTDTLGGVFAQSFATQNPDLQVDWLSIGKNGLRVGEAISYFREQVPPTRFDLLLIGLGANDIFKFTPVWQWRKQVRALLQTASGYSTRIIWATLPPVGRFPIFNTPDRQLLRQLFDHQRLLLESAIHREEQCSPVPFIYPKVTFELSEDMFVSDGVHPSAKGYRIWVNAMMQYMATL